MRVAVLGAGAWGTAISCVLAARLEVTLWARDPKQAAAIGSSRRNERYLPGFELPSTVKVAGELAQATRGIQLALAATPVAGLRELLQHLGRSVPVVWLCKGFEEGTGELPHQIAAASLGDKARFGALSGPSFAEEVARGLPCALTLAARDAAFAREAAAMLHGGRMRVYYSADLVGVGLERARGRPLKDVVASLGHVAEGVHSAREAAKLAKARGIEMPVTEAVSAVLEGQLNPATAVERLLARESKMER